MKEFEKMNLEKQNEALSRQEVLDDGIHFEFTDEEENIMNENRIAVDNFIIKDTDKLLKR